MEEDRLLKLEERIAWLEKHVLEQDKAMLGLADENARLKKQLLELRERSLSGGSVEGSSEPLSQERPPHY